VDVCVKELNLAKIKKNKAEALKIADEEIDILKSLDSP